MATKINTICISLNLFTFCLVINLSGYNEEIDMPSIKETNGTSALTENGGIKKRSKRRKGKGLALVADEIGETFLRVAVSSTKLVAGADKKEVSFTISHSALTLNCFCH